MGGALWLFGDKFGKSSLNRRNVNAARDLMNEGPVVALSQLGPTARDTTFFVAGLYLGRVAANEDLPEVPEELLCPLTHELMVDPVMTQGGHTYERVVIERWLTTHNTDPLTGAVLHDLTLRPNVLVRGMCRKHAPPEPTPAEQAAAAAAEQAAAGRGRGRGQGRGGRGRG